jgi:hypothetical protein
MFAAFVYDPIRNTMTFYTTHESKEAILTLAPQKFKDDLWIIIYKFASHENLFDFRVPVTKWHLDTKSAGSKATGMATPMQTAYRVDDYEWFFKTF